MNYNKEVLENKIIFFSPNDPFTWASGIKSPIYCDNRLVLGYPDVRKHVEEKLTELIKLNYSDVEIIMGTATAGIPHSAIVGDYLNLPCGYVRGSAKKHGRTNQIEGVDVVGKKVVVIEDLISTGKSVIESVEVLQEAGADVLGVVAIFSYNMSKADELFKAHNLNYITVSNIDILLNYALENQKLEENEVKLVKSFLEDPASWYDREFSK